MESEKKEFQLEYLVKKERCKRIINAAVIACGGIGTGLAQLPLADSALITPIQIGMIINIGKEFDMEITESMGTAIISSLTGVLLGRSVSSVLFGWVPVVGNLVNTLTAAGLTRVIGDLAFSQFSEDWRYGSEKSDADVVKPFVVEH